MPPHLLDALIKVGLQWSTGQELSSALQHDVNGHALIRNLGTSQDRCSGRKEGGSRAMFGMCCVLGLL